MPIELKILRNTAIVPKRMTKGSAGYDLYTTEDLSFGHNGCTLDARTGIAIHIGDHRYMGLMAPRSSLHKHNLELANTIGIIDSDYQGEIVVKLKYTGNTVYTLPQGTRVAQLIIVPICVPGFDELPEVVEFSASSDRGDGGFGSTGQ